MKWLKMLAIVLALSTLLPGCIRTLGCPDGAIEWVDLLMINDIKYQHYFPDQGDEPIQVEKGKLVGEVKFKMADKACSNHKMINGDAAYLEKGTPIYEVKGIPSAVMVAANDRVYITEQNKKAKKMGDLYPIKGLVNNIYIESTEDGSRIHPFPQDVKERFLDKWLQLKLIDNNLMEEKNAFAGKPIFLEIEFHNGASFRHLYWRESNAFGKSAYGNEELQEIMNKELAAMEK